MVHGDCVSKNVAITIIFLYAMLAMPVQFTVEGCFTGKIVYKLQDAIGITTTPGGLILVTDCKTKKIHILKSNIVAPDWKTKQNIHPEICTTKRENLEG